MKKLVYVVMLVAVVAFAGCAFAAGHVSGKYVPITLEKDAITPPEGATIEDVKSISAEVAKTDAASIDATLLGGITLDVSHDAGVSGDITLNISPATLKGYADKGYISIKGSSDSFKRYDASYTNQKVTIKDVRLDDHFSTAKVYITGKEMSDSSSSGCNAGFAALLLLAATPICFFRKK